MWGSSESFTVEKSWHTNDTWDFTINKWFIHVYFFSLEISTTTSIRSKEKYLRSNFSSLDYTLQEFSIQIGSKWYKIKCIFWLCTLLVKWFEFKNCNFSIDNLWNAIWGGGFISSRVSKLINLCWLCGIENKWVKICK